MIKDKVSITSANAVKKSQECPKLLATELSDSDTLIGKQKCIFCGRDMKENKIDILYCNRKRCIIKWRQENRFLWEVKQKMASPSEIGLIRSPTIKDNGLVSIKVTPSFLSEINSSGLK